VTDTIRTAVVGTGNWGLNHVRVLAAMPSCRVTHLVDVNEYNLAGAQRLAPGAQALKDYRFLLDRNECDAVVVATPAETHYEIARDFLTAGKHVLVEKPLALLSAQAADLNARAQADGVKLMVGHLLHYHPAIRYIRQAIAAGELGAVRCITAARLNPMSRHAHEDALWSFAPHDVATALHLLDRVPISVQALGCRNRFDSVRDVVFFNLPFPDGVIVHGHGSWLGTHKVRRLSVIGEFQTIVFDDREPARKVRVYDTRGIPECVRGQAQEQIRAVRGSDPAHPPEIHSRSPEIEMVEPLRLECEHFMTCIRENRPPLTGGADGLRVVSILNACEQSLAQQGTMVPLGSLPGLR
jgi:predicted dehydrogenase